MDPIEYHPIGTIHSPFHSIQGMPIQPPRSTGVEGRVKVFEAYWEGLQDLDGFSHLILLYHFHQAAVRSLVVTPFLDDRPHGVFATRAPTRPNPIGMSIVKLVRVEQGILHIADVDMLDGTPLLDIKPYIPDFDQPAEVRTGWLSADSNAIQKQLSDGRFEAGHSTVEADHG